ncbi:MAG: hypothetical protein JJV98_14020, partial [Desulfosarcina sp.]|nr:hypothetical protein [Desulfobacterales bacterium]
LFFPWFLLKPAWYGFSLIKHDESYRFLAVWVLATIAIFSLISGKQIHYLIPMLPAVSLLTAKNIVTYSAKSSEYAKLHYPVAISYMILGVLILSMPLFQAGRDIANISIGISLTLSVALIFLGGTIFFTKPSSIDKLIKIIALSSMVFFITVGTISSYIFFSQYGVSNIANILKEKQEKGYAIIHYGTYHGQYQFLGRLTQPLVVLSDKKSIREYAGTHKKVLLITYEEPEEIINKDMILYEQPHKDEKAVLWKEKGIPHFLKR